MVELHLATSSHCLLLFPHCVITRVFPKNLPMPQRWRRAPVCYTCTPHLHCLLQFVNHTCASHFSPLLLFNAMISSTSIHLFSSHSHLFCCHHNSKRPPLKHVLCLTSSFGFIFCTFVVSFYWIIITTVFKIPNWPSVAVFVHSKPDINVKSFCRAGLVNRSVWAVFQLCSVTHLVCFSETLPVEYLGGKALCMNQYYEVLSSCRIPGLKKDSVVNHAKDSTPPKHINVIHNFQVRSWSGGRVNLALTCLNTNRLRYESSLIQHITDITFMVVPLHFVAEV